MNTEREKAFASLLAHYEDFHKPKFDPVTGEVFTKQIGKDGKEYLDDTPIAPPVGYRREKTMVEHIREAVRNAKLAEELARNDIETFEESEDFEVGDDFDPSTPWENDFDPPISEVAREVESERQRTAQVAVERQQSSSQASPAPSQAPATSAPPSGPNSAST